MDIFLAFLSGVIVLGVFGYLGRLTILTVQRWLLARQESSQLPNDLAERLLRIERRLGDVEEEQRQLRTEVDWQGKLLRRPDAEVAVAPRSPKRLD